MKKCLLFTIFTCVIIVSNSFATIKRVGYFGTPIPKTDYSDLQKGVDSSAVGDTILLFPGSYNAYMKKKLTIIGAGYFVNGTGSNPNLQNITGTTTVTLYLYGTASGSTFISLDNASLIAYSQETVNDLTFQRINGTIYFNEKPLKNWTISQSNLATLGWYWTGGTITNLSVSNSYINSINFNSGAASGNSGQLNNCIIYTGYFNNSTILVTSSIFTYYKVGDGNCVYQNSIAYDAYPLPTGNGNQNLTSTVMNGNVFVGYSTQGATTNDGRWVLKAGSPAIGKGVGGKDCGIFGGVNPYKLSGIAPIPTFYKLSAPSNVTSTNPYTITFSVRSNN